MNRIARFVSILGLLISVVFASQAASQTLGSNTWSSAGQMTQARTGAAEVLLANGRVLITGGTNSSGIPQASTEIYDPATGVFTASPAMNVPRANHAAIFLRNGDVLVTGGLTTGGGYSASAEIYSVKSQQWTLLQSSLGSGLAYQAMAQLSDGNILIAGGTSTTKVVSSLVLYNVTTQTFTPIGSLITPRTNAVAAPTPDGRILIAGGADVNGVVLASTEIFAYNAATLAGTVSAGPTMSSARLGATATSTYDGVAVIDGNNGQNDLGTAEIFSQWTNTFTVVSGGTPRSHHFAALLPENGGILVTGGTGGTAVDLLQPWANNKAGAFISASASLFNQNGGFGSPSVLGSLLAGGGMGTFASTAEVYRFPTISTNSSDYAPGTPVKMTGTGFQPFETVNLHLHEWVDQTTEDDPDATATADALGNFSYSGYAPTPKDLGARYHLTAIGGTSGYQAQTIFTDGLTSLDFLNAPLDQAVNACGELTLYAGGSSPYGTVYLSDSTTTGTFYTNSSCTGTAITSFTPTSTDTNIWYKNSASGDPELTACSVSGGLLICELDALFGTTEFTSQTESIYSAPTQLVFTSQPGGGAPGVAWPVQPVLAVQDANYNTIGSNSDPIKLTLSTNPGAGTLTCTNNPMNASSGVAAFAGCTITGATSSNSCYKLTATDTTLNFTVTSACFYIENAASQSNSTVIASPTTVVDNGTATSTITVTLKDSSNNLLANKMVTLAAGSGGSVITTVSGTTNSSGVATFTVTDTNPETVTYTATDTSDNVVVTETATVTFAPGAVSATNSTVRANPTTVPADGATASTITVTLEDSSGDPIAGETVTLAAGSGSSVIVGSPATTNASGVATFTVTDTTVQNVTYTASYSGASGSGSLTTHTVTVSFINDPTTLTLSVNPNAITVGSTPVVLTAALSVTTGGAPVAGATVSFYQGTTSCSTSSTLLATFTTSATGSATYDYATGALAAGSYELCAFSTAATLNNVPYAAASSGPQTLTVGAAPTFTWTTAPPASAVYNTTFTILAADHTTGDNGAVTYGVTGGCTITTRSPYVVTMTSGTTACQVTANLAAYSTGGGHPTYYGPATLTATVTAQLATPTALVLTGVPANAGDGVTFTVGTTGGSAPGDTGTVTYGVTGICTVAGNQVTMNASTGSCTVTANKASDGNYAAVSSAPLTASAGIGMETVTFSNTSQTYTGSPLPVTVITTPVAGVSVNTVYTGTSLTYGPTTTAPTLVGTYSVTSTITDPNYSGSGTTTETISQLSPGLTLALQSGTTNPSPYGTTASFVLTVSTSPCPTGTVQLTVDGTAVGAAQAIECSTQIVFSSATIEPGTHNIAVQYSGDSNNAPSTSNIVSFTVSADTTSVTLSSTATTINVGQSISFTATVSPSALNASANGPAGTVEFLDGTTVIDTETLSGTSPYTVVFTTTTLAAGSHSISATYLPGSDAEFSGSSSAIDVTVTVNLIAPVITWADPANIVYGTPLSAAQLNATATDPTTNATVPGTFTYLYPTGTVLPVGTTNLQVNFVPSDPTTYSSQMATVPITVTGATLTVTANNETQVYGGPAPPLTYAITGYVNGDPQSVVTGEASCTTTTTVTSTVSGSPYNGAITCTQGSLAAANYTFTFVAGNMTVTPATPTLSLICPNVPYDGNSHACQGSAVGIDGATQVSGTWAYNPPSETAPGTYPTTGTFTSTDPNGDYVTGGTATGTLIIGVATSSVTLTCPSSVAYNGTAQTPCTATATGSGGLSQTLTVNYTNNTNIGTATATATYAGDPDHTGSTNTVTFAISPAAVSVTGGSYTGVYTGTAATIPACTITGTYVGTLTCTETPTSVGPPVGSGSVVPTVVGSTSNFTVITTNGAWSITLAPTTVTVNCPSSVVYNGTAQTPCTDTVTGAGGLSTTVPITYTSNVSAGTATATATYAGDANHSAQTTSVNFNIAAAAVIVQTGSYSGIYDGSSHALSACTVTGTAGNTYTGGLVCTNIPTTEGPDVGSGTVPSSSANLSGDTLANFAITYLTGSWSITKATSSVTVTCPTSVVYDDAAQTPCSAIVTLVGGATQPVTPVTYSANVNVGLVTASATYAGTTDYATSTGSATFNITAATVTATAGSYSGAYTGASVTIPACTITGVTFATGLTCADSPATEGPAVGTGSVTPVPSGDTGNFTINLVNGTWTISPGLETITLGNLSQFYTGNPATAVTATTAPVAGLAVTILYGTTATPTSPTSATPPTAVGSYAVLATINNPDYSGSTTGTLTILSASSGLSLSLDGASSTIPYGDTATFYLSLPGLGGTGPCPTGTVTWYLDGVAGTPVTLNGSSCSTPVTFVTADTLSVATHNVYAVYSGDTNYTGGTSNTVPITVSDNATMVSLSGPTSANVDATVTFTALVQPAFTPGSGALLPTGTVQFYNGTTPIGSPVTLTELSAGLYLATLNTSFAAQGTDTISATYVSTDATEYPGSSSTLDVTVTVSQIVPKITWATPGSIVYGTPLSATQLNATAADPTTGDPVPGTFAYNPAALALVPEGTNTLSVTFTPTNSTGPVYSTATATVDLVVTAAAPTLTLSCPTATYNGTAQQTCVGTAKGVTGGATPTGTWSYSPVSETEQGTYTVTGTFTSTNPDYQTGGTAIGTLTINAATVTATAGSYTGVYTGAVVTIPACTLTGTYTAGLTCADTPATVGPGVSAGAVIPKVTVNVGTTSDYAITLVNGAYSITKATSTVTVTCPTSVVYNGAAQTPCTATVTGAGGLSQSVTVTYTNNTNAGTATASATYAGDANHSTSTNTANFTISAAPVTATAGSYNGAYNGVAHAPAACVVTGTYIGTLTCTDNPASVGPAVGSGTVLPVVSGGTLTNFAITSVDGTWSITQTSTTVTVSCPASEVYNGTAQTPCTATVTGAGGLDQTLTVTYTNNTNTGTATASASYAGTTTYAPSNGSSTFTITAAAVTATAGSLTGVYTGAAQTPSACVVTGTYKGALTCTDNPASVGPAVGSGTVTPTVNGGSSDFTITLVNGTWSITQATSTVTVTCPASVTYNGAAQTPCTAAVTGAGGLSETLTVTYSNNTNAGTATATASFAGDANHSASTKSTNFTINAAPVTATAGSVTAVYNGAAQTPSACTITGTYKVGLSCTDNPASVGPAVGTGTVTPTVTGGTANFAITLVDGAWSITKATSTVTVTCPTSVAYNGAAQTPCTATVTGAGGLSQAVTVTYTNNTNAGTATATATYAGDADHSTSTNSANFTITPVAVTATAGSLTGVYTGAAQTPSACVVTGTFKGTLICTDNPATVGPAVGTGTVTPTVSGGTLTDFTITLVNGAWSITKATSTVTVTCPTSVAYNGTAQTPCTATVTGAGGLSQAVTVTYTNNTNAGTATATATYAGDANHTTSTNTANFTITSLAVTATAGSLTGTYTGAAQTPSACTLTGTSTAGLTCTDNPASVGPAVGSGTVTPVVSGGTSNFTITLVNGAWSITPATSSVTVTCPTSVAYNGAAQTPCTATVTGPGGLSQALTVTYTNNTNAGTATASASYAGSTDYAAGTNSANFTITPVAVTATAGSVTAVYNGAAQTPSACTLTGAFTGGLTCTDNPASVGPAVGTGTVTPTVTGGTTNFAVTLVNGAWSITKATSTVTVTCPASVTYNGTAQTPCTATVTGPGGLSQSLTVTYTNNTNAGTATASATYAGTTNYAAGSNSANFTISPAAVTATAGSLNSPANGSAQSPSACTVTGAYTVGLSCTDNPASVGPAVGSGTVTPVVTGGTANFTITLVNGSWNITQPSLISTTTTVTCPVSVVYSGAAQTPCTATVTGSGGLSQTLTVTYTNNTNAGTATASASYAGNTTYAPSSNSATFTITPVTVTATAGSLTGVYTGAAQSPSACTVTGTDTTGLSCANNPASVGPAVGSGTVAPVVTGGTTNFNISLVNGAWSITKATATVTVTCPASVLYNGAAQTPCTASATGAGGLSQTLTVTYTNNTNAGTASASASFAGDANHATATNSANFTINAAPVTATAGSVTAVYNGSAQTPSACALTGAYTVGLTCTDNPTSVGPAVGSGTVTPVVSGGTANFAITLVNGSWNITQASLTSTTTTVNCPASVGYNGTAQTPCTATVTGSGGLSQSLTVTYTNNTNAGTATASASYAGNTTYAPSNNSATFTITPVAVTATAGSLTAVYNGAAQTPSACAVTGGYTVGLSCTDNPASVGPAVGSGTVTPTVTGGTSNFTITPVNGAWSITQATATVTVSCPTSVIFNGAAQTPCTATATGSGGLSQTLTVTYTSNTNAGTATASASFAGDANHPAGTNSANFTINAAPVTATAGSFSGAFNGSAQTPSACTLTGAYTVGLTCADNPTSVGPAVGSGTVTPVVTGGTSNFAITLVNGTWNISQASLTSTTTTVSCPASVTYNGAAETPCTATVTGTGGLSQTLTVTYTNNTNAGTATASASYAGNTTYAPSNNSATFSINPVPVTATAGSLNAAYNGSAQSPSACAVTGAYTVGLSCADNPASVGPAVGSGTVTPVVTGGTSNFAITLVNGTWNITQASLTSTTTTVICPASVGYNGAAQAPCTATVTGAGGLSQTLTVTYTNNINAGTATASASYAGTSTYAASNNSATFTISPAAVTATAGSLSAAYNGSAQSPSACAVTGAYTAGLSCTDNPASVGPAVGSGTVTPVVAGGSSNFTITLVNGAWSITQSSLTSTTTTVSCPASVVYSGAAQAPCTATVTGAGGLSQTLTVTYSNNTNAGTATASASYAGNTTYASSNNSATFTIAPAAATVTLSNLAQNYTGSPLPVTVTTVPPGLSVNVLYSSGSYPSSTTAPTNPGTYSVSATVANANYAGSATGSLVISSASTGLTLQLRSGTPEPSPYGMMVYFDLGLGGTPCPTGTVQFYVDGTAAGSAVTLNGSSCSSPVTFQTATLAPGSHTVYAVYSGDTNYAGGTSNTVTHGVMADTTAVTLATSATTLNVGESVTFTATVTPTSLDPSAQGPAGTVNFSDGGTQIGSITLSSTAPYTAVFSTSTLAAGPHTITATYVSSDGEFTGSSSMVTVTVTSGLTAPTINWSNPANIVYGTPLGATQLNATATDPTTKATVAGTFAYTPVTGTVVAVGTVNLSVTFTPADPTTYSTQTATVTLTVTAASPTLALTCTEVTYDGNPHACVGTATAIDGVTPVNGSWSYSPATETAAGSYPVTGTFTSTNSDYQGGTATGTLKIDPAPVTATAGSLTGNYTGSAQTPSACSVTGAYTGGLTCADSPASVGPAVGSGTVTPVVTGGNSNFAITLVNGAWSITQGSSTTTTTTVSCPASMPYSGAALTPCTATVTGSGGLSQTLTVSYTNNTNAGTATATASYAGNTTYSASNGSATFTIAQASQAINFTQPASPVIYGVSPITLSATGGASGSPVIFSIDAGSTGSGTISGGVLTVTGVGNLIIDANQAGNSNYLTATKVTRTIVVNVAGLTVAANNASRVYGASNPTFTGSVTGAVRGDAYTESFSTVATITSNVGTYPVVPSVAGADLSDYSVTLQNGVLTISQAGTTTSMTSSGTSVTPGQTVTLTANVASATTGTPTGSVAFYDGTTLLGTVPLTAGSAALTTSSLTAGTSNALQAVYSGDTNFTTSSSASSTVGVAALDFSMTVLGTASQTVNSGSAATYQVMVNPLYGSYPGPVSFAASGLPANATVSFSPPTLTAGAGQQTVTVTVQTVAVAKETAPSIGRKLAPLALALFMIPLLGAGRLRRQGRRLSRLASILLLLGCTLAGAMMATGCGGASLKEIDQNYTIVLTSTSGNVQHTAPVTLVIK